MRINPTTTRRDEVGFSVTELMVAIAVMGVIVFALFSVFNQTQRALRSTEAQSEVSEKARAVLDLVSREIEATAPSFKGGETNFVSGPDYAPRVQSDERIGLVPSPTTPRTNVLYSLFLEMRETNAVKGLGYRVVNYTNGLGALVRFQTGGYFGNNTRSNLMYSNFMVAPYDLDSTNATFHHVADGVIHFKVTTFDPSGFRMGYDTTNRYPPEYSILRLKSDGKTPLPLGSDAVTITGTNVILQQAFSTIVPYSQSETRAIYQSNAVPAYVEVELGMLEPEAVRQYAAMIEDNNPAAKTFLSRKINRVHLFRKRIPIQTVAQ